MFDVTLKQNIKLIPVAPKLHCLMHFTTYWKKDPKMYVRDDCIPQISSKEDYIERKEDYIERNRILELTNFEFLRSFNIFSQIQDVQKDPIRGNQEVDKA
jgi:hypothetical protein